MEAFGGLSRRPGEKKQVGGGIEGMYCNNISRNLRVRSRKKKKQSSTMEACYNIFRILTIFKVVLSGGPIIRKKKRGR